MLKRKVLSPEEIKESQKYKINDIMEIYKYYQKRERYITCLRASMPHDKMQKYYEKMRGIGLIDEEIFDGAQPAWVANGFKFEIKDSSAIPEVLSSVVDDDDKKPAENLCVNGNVELKSSDYIEDHIEEHIINLTDQYNGADKDIKFESIADESARVIVATDHHDIIKFDKSDYTLSNYVSEASLLLCGLLRDTGTVSPDMYKNGKLQISREIICHLNNPSITFEGSTVFFESVVNNIRPFDCNTSIIYSLRYVGKLYPTFRLTNGNCYAFDDDNIYNLPFSTYFYVYRHNDKFYSFTDHQHSKVGNNVIYMDLFGDWYTSVKVNVYEYQKITLTYNFDWLSVFSTLTDYCDKGVFKFIPYCINKKFNKYDVISINAILGLFGIFRICDKYHYFELAYPVRADSKIAARLREFKYILGDCYSHYINYVSISNKKVEDSFESMCLRRKSRRRRYNKHRKRTSADKKMDRFFSDDIEDYGKKIEVRGKAKAIK